MSYQFDGVDDILTDSTNGGVGLDITTYSIMAWVKVGTIPNSTGHVMGRATGTHLSNQMMMRLPASDSDVAEHMFRHGTTDDAGHAYQDSATLQYAVGLTSWNNIIGTYGGSRTPRWDAYIDGAGTFLYGNTATPSVVNQTFSIGKVNDNSQRAFAGRIAHVAIWNRVLTGTEITDLAAGGNPLAVAASGLLRYWPLTAAAATQADEQGSGHDLTVSGATYSSDDPTVDEPPSTTTSAWTAWQSTTTDAVGDTEWFVSAGSGWSPARLLSLS